MDPIPQVGYGKNRGGPGYRAMSIWITIIRLLNKFPDALVRRFLLRGNINIFGLPTMMMLPKTAGRNTVFVFDIGDPRLAFGDLGHPLGESDVG